MTVYDLTKVSLLQIYRNRSRYTGVFIGICVGIAGLVVVLTTGDVVEQNLALNMEIMGNITVLRANWDFGRTQRWHHGEFFDSDVDTIRKLPNVLAVCEAVIGHSSMIEYRKKKTTVRLMGIRPEFFSVSNLPLSSGREISTQEVKDKRHVCMIGSDISQKLFGPNVQPNGKLIVMNGMAFQVVGVLSDSVDRGWCRSVVLPISLARSKIPGMNKIRVIYIRATHWDAVPELRSAIARVLEKSHPGYEKGISVSYRSERLRTMQLVILLFKYFVYAVIGVTLMLGGLGITNVMLAVVTERTKEIGLRKAVGATEGLIMWQFLSESLTVSLIGAMLGIGLGAVGVQMFSKRLEAMPDVSVFLTSVGLAITIGILLGVISGLLPARRAGMMDTVDAMKFE